METALALQELILAGVLDVPVVVPVAASAAPGGNTTEEQYIPQPRDNLDDLDEAVQAVWRGADKKEIDGILKWAASERRRAARDIRECVHDRHG